MRLTLFAFSMLLCTLLVHSDTASANTAEDLNHALCDRLEQCNAQLSALQPEHKERSMQHWLPVLYDKTGLQPLWITKDGPGKKAAILLSILQNSAQEGLSPEQYKVNRITSLWNSRNSEELIELDTLLTLAFILYTHDALKGQAHTGKDIPTLSIKPDDAPSFDPLALLQTALSSPDLDQFLAALLPTHKYYKNLRAALPYYQSLAANGGWPQIASGKSIRPGEQDSRIPAIRKRLHTEGFLPATTNHVTDYDEKLTQAVILFQRRHGLNTDGVIGKTTIAAMNIPAQQKVRQIITNLERWRWEARNLGEKYVLVDIAGFTLEAIKDDELIMEMAVVVGTQQHETPVFSDHIRYIELNPFWNVPTQIARDEMLVELRKNPYYLQTNHIRLFNNGTPEATEISSLSINWNHVSPNRMSQFKLRQDPGKWNALGAIKFVFPNRYNVYMHDTPAQLLFQRSSRAFSHGCIRLSNPVQLAVLLLSETGKWPEERLREVIATGKRTIINLQEPLPVHITYQTVKSDQDGKLSFHADIYNRDEPLEKILFKKEETKQTSAKGNKNDLQVDTQDAFRVQGNKSSPKQP